LEISNASPLTECHPTSTLHAVPTGVMGAKFDGVHWDPPPSDKYTLRNPRPKRPESLRIYEAHVGMSSEEEEVASYTYFKGGRGRGLGWDRERPLQSCVPSCVAVCQYRWTNPHPVILRHAAV
jgi:1,4-alpha-glucan branching enzyme